jgi:pescadillo protein
LDSEEMKKIKQREEESKILKSLFKNCVFYLSREVPNEIFGLAILSSGGLYGDESDNTAFDIESDSITHYVVDRPAEFITQKPNKEYIQPQWIFDCINSKKLLPVSDYAPGKKLPPHLSPFYEYVNGEYKPNKEININIEEPQDEEKREVPNEDVDLREMLLSKNKKKLLQKVREEKAKKIKTVQK